MKETSPAQGFATTDQVQEFTFEYGGAEKETLSYEFTFEDEATTVEFTKTSLTDGKEIEGAKLKVTDELEIPWMNGLPEKSHISLKN